MLLPLTVMEVIPPGIVSDSSSGWRTELMCWKLPVALAREISFWITAVLKSGFRAVSMIVNDPAFLVLLLSRWKTCSKNFRMAYSPCF